MSDYWAAFLTGACSLVLAFLLFSLIGGPIVDSIKAKRSNAEKEPEEPSWLVAKQRKAEDEAWTIKVSQTFESVSQMSWEATVRYPPVATDDADPPLFVHAKTFWSYTESTARAKALEWVAQEQKRRKNQDEWEPIDLDALPKLSETDEQDSVAPHASDPEHYIGPFQYLPKEERS